MGLSQICLGVIGTSEKNNRFGRDGDELSIEFGVLQDILMVKSVLTVENMGLELDHSHRCRSQCGMSCQERGCREERSLGDNLI